MNRKAVDKLLAKLRKDAGWSERHDALAAIAQTLASTLDEGAGTSTAAVSRELRNVVELLSQTGESDAFDRLAAELSSAVEYRTS